MQLMFVSTSDLIKSLNNIMNPGSCCISSYCYLGQFFASKTTLILQHKTSPNDQYVTSIISNITFSVFYFIITIENAVFLILWRVQTKGDATTLNLPAWGIENLNIDEFLIYCCGALHAIGLIVMVLYYQCCHPGE